MDKELSTVFIAGCFAIAVMAWASISWKGTIELERIKVQRDPFEICAENCARTIGIDLGELIERKPYTSCIVQCMEAAPSTPANQRKEGGKDE